MNSRRITLIVAIVLAVTTGLLVLRYFSSVNATQQVAVVASKPVVIANRDIPTRTKITPDMLTIVKRPEDQVEPGAVADPKQAIGDVSLIAIPANSTITDTKIGQPAAVGLTARLKPGMRAVTIAVDAIKSVNGMIQPGDRVDVLASVAKGSADHPRTFAIIRGALVLALNSSIEPIPDQSPSPGTPGNVPATVTLGVSVQQASLLTVADINTTLRLALRSPNEPLRGEEADAIDFQDATNQKDVPPPVKPAPPPVVAAAPAPPKKTGPSVTIVDGDKLIEGIK